MRPKPISLQALKNDNKVVCSNGEASLIDLGDDVACLEFHAKGNAIGPDARQMIGRSLEEVSQNYRGLVVANEGKNFCAGANIMEMLAVAHSGNWGKMEELIGSIQKAILAFQALDRPVVAAPHRHTLGGGAEVCFSSDRVLLARQTYLGLVETRIGLIPAAGGCKELALRASIRWPDDTANAQAGVEKAFDTILLAKVSTDGHDAFRLGMTRPTDAIVGSEDYRIDEAKQAALDLVRSEYRKPTPQPIRVIGKNGKAALLHRANGMSETGFLTDYDLHIASKLAHVLAGGDVPSGTTVTEARMLELERETFLSLLGEPKTQQRIRHLLSTGEALRN